MTPLAAAQQRAWDAFVGDLAWSNLEDSDLDRFARFVLEASEGGETIDITSLVEPHIADPVERDEVAARLEGLYRFGRRLLAIERELRPASPAPTPPLGTDGPATWRRRLPPGGP